MTTADLHCRRWSHPFAVALLAVSTIPGVAGAQHLDNGDFEAGRGGPPSGWFLPAPAREAGFELEVVRDQPHGGKQCAHLHRDPKEIARGSFGNCMQEIDPRPFRGKRVRFRCWVRAEVPAASQAMLWLRVDREGDQRGFFDNMGNRPIGTGGWRAFEITGDVADDAERIALGMMLSGAGSAWFDDATLEIVGEDVPTTGFGPPPSGPGLVEVRMEANAVARRDFDATTLHLPLPLSYRDQVPLTLRLELEPAVSATAAITAGPGPNHVLELTLRDVEIRTEFAIRMQSVVLVAPTDFAAVPKTAAFPAQWPPEAQPWLASTWCCDHEDARVHALATEIRGDQTDVLAVIRSTLDRAGKTFRAATGHVTELTAVQALDHQGSCTSCANLVAALLRGAGVPARVLAGYPLWSGPLQTHYIVEAFVPEYGWYPIESTRCEAPWPNHQQINVSIVPIEHEAQQLAGQRFGIAGAVPFLSLTEGEEPFPLRLEGTLKQYCDHEARLLRQLGARPAEWRKALGWAQKRWQQFVARPLVVADGAFAFGPAAATLGDVELRGLERALK